jgi:hypothetical protein
MISWKALLAGCATILVLGLLVQLAFIFVVVGFNAVAASWPPLVPWGRPLAYVSGTLVYFGIMSTAGYLTAEIARRHVLLHALITGSLVTGASLLLSLGSGKLTVMSLAFFLSGIVFTLSGALLWRRRRR